jgi:hypothetical protein
LVKMPRTVSWDILSCPLRQAPTARRGRQGRLFGTELWTDRESGLLFDDRCQHSREVGVKLQVPPLRYPGFPVQEIRVRSGRDDKVEGGGPPWHGWRWMDRVGSQFGQDYSVLRACIGSAEAARRAGTKQASRAAISRRKAAAVKTEKSIAPTP